MLLSVDEHSTVTQLPPLALAGQKWNPTWLPAWVEAAALNPPCGPHTCVQVMPRFGAVYQHPPLNCHPPQFCTTLQLLLHPSLLFALASFVFRSRELAIYSGN